MLYSKNRGKKPIKANSSSTSAAEGVATWLPLIMEAIKGLDLKVKVEGDKLYIALGNDSQLAITPTSESAGSYEEQVKEDDVVKVKSEGSYQDLKTLLDTLSKASSGSLSSNRKTAKGGKTVLSAGKNYQKALASRKLNSSTSTGWEGIFSSTTKPNSRNQRIAKRRGTLNSNRAPQSLKAGYSTAVPDLSDELFDVVSNMTPNFQKVSGVIFNKPDPINNGPGLYIAYWDGIEGLVVVSRIDTVADGGVFNDLTTFASSVFGVSDGVENHTEEVLIV